MSSLIKASAASVHPIHRFAIAKAVDLGVDASPEEPLLSRIVELEGELSELNASLPKRLEQAEKDGARKALKVRSDAEGKALDELKATATAALDEWKARLNSWELLATGIARAVLEQVFANAAGADEHLTSAVKTRLARIESALVVRLRVSQEDFPTSDALTVFAAELGQSQISADPKLSSGSCIIELRVGEIEVGPGAQWLRITELLDQIEREEAGQ